MSIGNITQIKAAEVCRYFALGDEAKKSLQPDIMPASFLQVLAERKLQPDAIQFIAHFLPKRQAVFWALACVKQVETAPAPEIEQAIKATERWIADPSEENRQATMQAAEIADTGTAAGCAALAAYYSEGIQPTTDPKQNARIFFMTARLVAGSVMLAATGGDPEKMADRFGAFVSKGLEIVSKTTKL